MLRFLSMAVDPIALGPTTCAHNTSKHKHMAKFPWLGEKKRDGKGLGHHNSLKGMTEMTLGSY